MDKDRRKIYYSLGKKKRHTIKSQFMVNNYVVIIHNLCHKKGKRHDYIYKNIKRIILLPTQNKLLLYLTLDIGVKKDFPEQLSALAHKKKINLICHRKKKSITKFIPKKENSDRVYHICRL